MEIQENNAQFNKKRHIFGILGCKTMLACGNSYSPLKMVLITGISLEKDLQG